MVNTITKSGGNRYSGLFDYRYTNDDWPARTSGTDLLKPNPALGNADVLKRLNDYTVQLGGPLKKDKAFWWASVQRYSFENDPAGPRTIRTEVSPRYNGKLTFNLTPNDTLIGSFQYDNYNVTGRPGYPGGTLSTDKQTLHQDSPEAVWNAQYRKVFSSEHVPRGEVHRATGATTTPTRSTRRPIRIDNDTGEYSGGAGYYYYADRDRNQVNVALSKYAEASVSTASSSGLEIERSSSQSRSDTPVVARSAPATSSTTAACRPTPTAGSTTTSTARTSASRSTPRTPGRWAA